MKSYLAIALALCSGVLLSADRTFPSAGGDLATDDGWGGKKPDSGDNVYINKAGDYIFSDDVTFNSFNVSNGACNVNLSNAKLTLGKKGDGAFYCKPNGGGRTVFSGGKIVFSNHGRCFPYVAPDSVGVVEFTGGCVITNADYFYATRSSSNGRVEITGGTMIFATNRFAVLQGNGMNNVVEINNGSKVFATGNVYSELGGNQGAVEGGNELIVAGAGSLFSKDSDKDFVLGNVTIGNKLTVVDGGKCSLSGKGGLKVRTSYNEIVVSNATFSCANAFCLGDNDNSSYNIFRITGPDITKDSVSLPFMGDWLISGHHHKISIENGAKWRKGSANSFFTNAHHCVFSVKDMGTQFGDLNYAFYLGTNNKMSTAVCEDNAVEICDGAIFNAGRFMLMGLRNSLVVSNATLNVDNKNDKNGIRIGYQDGELVAANCVLCLKGATPKINVDVDADQKACWVQNSSAIRFEIPKEGYVPNHVPVSLGGKFLFDSGCRFEIDCDDFARAGGGTLTLIETGADMTQATRDAIAAGVTGLPEGSSLRISKKSIKLHCPRGFAISIR